MQDNVLKTFQLSQCPDYVKDVVIDIYIFILLASFVAEPVNGSNMQQTCRWSFYFSDCCSVLLSYSI